MAAQLMDRRELSLAAVIAMMECPDLPTDDSGFRPLGAGELPRILQRFWKEWQRRASTDWDTRNASYISYQLTGCLRGHRRTAVENSARSLLERWYAFAFDRLRDAEPETSE